MEKCNPLDIVRIRNGAPGQNVLLPEDFSRAPVARALFSPESRRLYSLLRVVGFSACESFGAAFCKALILHPDALARASAAYDESPHAKRDLLEVITTFNPQIRDAELDRNVASFTRAALDAAMAIPLRIALADYQPEASQQCSATDSTRLKDLLESNAAASASEDAPERADDWNKWGEVTKFNAGGTSI
jgi:hypothetical protein